MDSLIQNALVHYQETHEESGGEAYAAAAAEDEWVGEGCHALAGGEREEDGGGEGVGYREEEEGALAGGDREEDGGGEGVGYREEEGGAGGVGEVVGGEGGHALGGAGSRSGGMGGVEVVFACGPLHGLHTEKSAQAPANADVDAGTQFTCFTGTKVHILTQRRA
jgi:hypothetical protein